ncbi:Dedicator of cytokinesis protein 3 [Eufriesea mexicana]|uniref:Dedicator of cytokinesis protein 3 n=1 Tax=Eufriesea mexicana TaxID=516756 RepID=A0A310SNE4_9HYME|nr:Dedicator of cytokinesis protein 3 [Eufriesea mexicana]
MVPYGRDTSGIVKTRGSFRLGLVYRLPLTSQTALLPILAVYNWRGDTRYGLPLEIGETVQILEECIGWYRGFSTKNRAVKGIFPSSYVYLKPCKIENEGLFESVIPLEDPVVREVTLVLREWGGIWKRLYVERENYKFTTLRKVMRELLEWRRQLLAGTLTTDQTRELKLKIINKVDWGNR